MFYHLSTRHSINRLLLEKKNPSNSSTLISFMQHLKCINYRIGLKRKSLVTTGIKQNRMETRNVCEYTDNDPTHLVSGNFSNRSRSLSIGAAIRPATVSNGGLLGALGCALQIKSIKKNNREKDFIPCRNEHFGSFKRSS